MKRQENEDAGRKCPSEGVSCENSSHMGGMRGSSHNLRVLRENGSGPRTQDLVLFFNSS